MYMFIYFVCTSVVQKLCVKGTVTVFLFKKICINVYHINYKKTSANLRIFELNSLLDFLTVTNSKGAEGSGRSKPLPQISGRLNIFTQNP